MNANIISRIPARYWGYLTLSLWGGITLFLLRQDAYSLNEGAAKALLLVWSIADQVASSVVTFGTPDLRVLLYAPAGFLWTGNVFAIKVLTALGLAITAWLLYSWKRNKTDHETALIATGLLLISPLTLSQIDTLSPGTYLLLAYALGTWLNSAYRANARAFGGLYFAQLLISAFSVSLHPAGLAYPLSLLWLWHKEPVDKKQQKYFFTGIGLTVLLTLIIKMGWGDMQWLQNPIKSLAAIVLDSSTDGRMSATRWAAGIAMLLSLAIIVFRQYRELWSDFMGRTLLIGVFLGAATSDHAWTIIALTLILYYGLPLLLRLQQNSSGGLMHQRGSVLLLILVLSTFFMRADRTHYEIRQQGTLPGQDQLIRLLADEAESERKAAEQRDDGSPPARLRAASQWPARTMIACKCDTLPLPPAAKDPQAQLNMLNGLTHLLFNPRDPANIMLTRNLSMITGEFAKTEVLLQEGVILRFTPPSTAPSPEKP